MSENERKKVKLRGGFSDRNGIDKLNVEIQLTDFDERTRCAILNALNYIFSVVFHDSYGTCKPKYMLFLNMLIDVYSEVLSQGYYDIFGTSGNICMSNDAYQNVIDETEECINNTIFEGSYDEILTLVEYLLNHTISDFETRGTFFRDENGDPCRFDEKKYMNNVFEKEYVGYRFVGNNIVPISDTNEINEINEAHNIEDKFAGCRKHIEKAVFFFSDRENPDYKNSIKESISAVESICKVITGNDNATLGESLKQLEKDGIKIHKSLKEGFLKLYGYASDEGGIRHAEGMFESDVSFEDAKYMLVSCCAFVNYLKVKYGKAEETKNEG